MTEAPERPGAFARLRDDAILRKLIARAGPNTLASLVGAVLGMVRSAILLRALGVVDYGQLAVVVAASTLVRQVFSVRTWEWSTIELTAAHVRRDPVRMRAVIAAGARLGLGASLATVVTVAVTATLFAESGRAGIDLAPLIRLYALVHLTTAFDDVAMATLRSAGWFSFLARYQLGASVLRVLLTLPLVLPGAGLGAAIGLTILAQLPASVWLVVRARTAFLELLPPEPSESPMPTLRSEWRRHLRLLATMSLTDTVKTFALDADPVVVGALSAPEEVGEFKATTTLMAGLHALSTPLYMAFYPELARAVAAKDLVQVRALRKRLTLLGLVLGGSAALGTALVGPWLMRRIFGPELEGATPDLRVMGLSMFVMVAHWTGPLFAGLGRPLRSTAAILTGLAVKAAIGFLLVPRLGSYGAAWAYTGYFAVVGVLGLILARGHEAWLVSGAQAATPREGDQRPGA